MRGSIDLIATGQRMSVDVAVEYVDVLASVNNAVLNNVIVTPTLDRLDPLPFAPPDRDRRRLLDGDGSAGRQRWGRTFLSSSSRDCPMPC